MTLLYLPDQNWATTPVATRDTLNESAKDSTARENQLTVAAENAALRVIYGKVRVGPMIANVLSYNGNLVILAVWAQGECDSMVDLQIDDTALAAGVTAVHHLGNVGQTVDATLVAAFAAQSPPVTYTDALPGICYSVITVPPGASTGFPRLNATIKGRKVWTGASTVWSDNPAWCLADFITNTAYGMGRTCDLASAASVAADCDVLAGGTEKLRTLNLALENVQSVTDWLDTLRTYAGCWVVPSGAGLKLVSDKAASSVASFSHAAGTIQSITAIKKRGVQSMPTVMTIQYTDTTLTPWRTATATVYAPGVIAGTTPRRESSVSLPGITRYGQAYREATERLNKLLLNDLSCTLAVFDEALPIEVGDVVDVTHPVGLSSKLMRVMNVAGEYGRFQLNLVEYDPAVYSAAVTASPTFVDTNLPNPTEPPAVSGITMTEEVYQLENGTYASRWRVTWSAASYAFLAHYRCELWIGSTLIQSARMTTAEWPTGPVQEGQTYTAKIAAVSSIGATGTWGTQSGLAQGKQLLPGNVPSITAFEAGGRVYAKWVAAVDIDIWRYELRYGAVGAAWADCVQIDRVDALALQTDLIPVGTWVLHVRALDSVQQYSPASATTTVQVTSDSSAFFVAQYDQTAPTLSNMAEYSLARTDPKRYMVTEDGASVASKFTGSLSGYANVMATYHASITASWLGEAEDFGLLLGGQWTGTADAVAVNGAVTSYLGNSVNGSTWNYPAGLSQKLNARFARLKHESTGATTLKVTMGTQQIRLDATPRGEVGVGVSSASGPVTVTLANSYVACKKLTITAQGTTARSATYDNIIPGTPTKFDVYVFDAAGNKIASAFRFDWEGV